MGRVILDLPSSSLLHLTASLPLAFLVAVYLLPQLAQIVLPRRWIRAVKEVASSPVKFASQSTGIESTPNERKKDRRLWILVAVGAVEAVGWTAGAVFEAVRTGRNENRESTKQDWIAVASLALVGLGWALSSLLLLEKRQRQTSSAPLAAPLLQFNFYLLHLILLSLHYISLALHPRRRTTSELVLTSLHTLFVFTVLTVALRMPLSSSPLPSSSASYSSLPTEEPLSQAEAEQDEDSIPVDSKDRVTIPSPEPHVTLFEWIVFSWIGPLIKKGQSKKLGYKDVWDLPFEMSSRGIRETSPGKRYKRVIPQVFFNNSQDLILSLTLGLVSSFLSYCSPYFLKQILQSLSPSSPGEPYDPTLRKSAYIYGLLAFIAQIARAEVDLQQLWHERRAIIRTRSQLMADVYEKALKRRDPSGATGEDTDKHEKKPENGAKGDGKKDGKKKVEEGRGSSSTGKIVSLMSGDANRVAMQLMSLSSIVAAPFELIIAISFLYQLLGWTCIAGLSVLAISLPVNNLLVTRRIKIHRSMLSARDSRMEVINELFNAIRFVKYSADEQNWLRRVGEKRDTELKWLLKTRINNLVMLISFACFTLILGKPLTVPIAFTSLALFALVRSPMSVLPMSITQLLQTYVSIQRLEQFFDEPEVDQWVSALHEEGASSTSTSTGSSSTTNEWEEIGIVDGTFKYSEQATSKNGDESKSTKKLPATAETNATAENGEEANGEGEGEATNEEPEFELRDLNVAFPTGKLSLVSGPTGSGKSSLFLALLGEMTCLSGEIRLRKGTPGINVDNETGLYDGVAYAAQLPWLQHASIRNNILFGSKYEKARYEATIEACALKPDLEMFDGGDETEIGERGISLSGGQKARVALARAVYSRAKTVFLDDPLSAVDSHTARHLYRKCLKGPLLENRTVVLVTHHISLCLPGAEYFVRFSDGRIEKQGKVADLDQSELQTELVEEDEEAEKAEEADKLEKEDTVAPSDPKEVERLAAKTAAEPSDSPPPVGSTTDVSSTPKGKLVEEETRQTGRVKWTVYSLYLRSAGYPTWTLIFLLILAGRIFRVADRWWFRVWGESYRLSDSFSFFRVLNSQNQQLSLAASFDTQTVHTLTTPEFPSASDHVTFYLAGYAIICLINLFVLVFGILVAFNGSFKASRALFTDSLTRVVHAPFRHFDATPVGRILSRYSQDMSTIDGSLMDQIRICMTHALSFVVQTSVICVVSPFFIPPAVLIIAAYVYYSLMYVKTSRDLRRLESVARSPIFSKFGETLQGIVTCRAFGSERRFLGELFDSVDTMLACAYSNALSNRYLLFRFDSLGALAVIITTYLALVARASPGLAALAITSAQALVQSVYWLCRFWSQLEVDLNAVERVTDLLSTPQEPPQVIEGKRPPANWPSSVGGISIDNLTVRYAPNLPAVIKSLSVEFAPRQRIGLIGRTGSGKSTLATSLLRFVEPSEGKIIIDGIDICSIGLYDLRSAVTLIPQEAVLFAGTIRSNLDPFNQHTDAECLDVLERVGLSSSTSSISATPVAGPSRSESPAPDTEEGSSEGTVVNKVVSGGNGRLSVHLTTAVSAGGHNFSAGQRQLLALARALLRQSRVIIMDESTASVDFETDEKIQHTIREGFADSLVITIAHRLRSIIDYDKILVLDRGVFAEFDSPSELLKNREGIFRAMCEKSADWNDLKRMAGLAEEEDS
ncbi:uncharacterized protein JCM6883_007204 [Sporobolomyces salmoneus]|uniref:uncharacterized protein n=1 Tax=Sporobolomyces salmoneus TaxID=183962 RepID=UPI0031770075